MTCDYMSPRQNKTNPHFAVAFPINKPKSQPKMAKLMFELYPDLVVQ